MQVAGMPFSLVLVMFVPGHMFSWAVEWAWLGLQTVLSITWLFVYRNRLARVAGIAPQAWTGFFLLVTAVGFLSCLHAAVVMNMQISSSDIQDVLRFLIFIPIALFIGSADRTLFADQVAKVLKFVVVFNLVTATMLLLNLPGLAHAIMVIYEEAKIQFDFGHIRIGIPFTNPNFAALVFVLAIGYFVFFRKSLLFVVLATISLFLTGSRSGLLSSVPIFVAAYVLYIAKSFRNVKIMLVLLVLHIVVVVSLSTALDAMGGIARIVELLNALAAGDLGQVDTASIRFELVQEALKFIERSPWLGVGSGRSYGLDVTDSQLIAWPVMYGIPVALLITFFFAWIFLGAIRKTRSYEHILGLIATAAGFFLMLSTGDFMKNYRLFFITVLIAHAMHLAVAERPATGSVEQDIAVPVA